MTLAPAWSSLLRLLQLASTTLPVGAYSYSEGLELLVENQTITDALVLESWMRQELRWGFSRMDAALMLRAYRAVGEQAPDALLYWNQWATASRDTEELRRQSWQMGRSLLRLFLDLKTPDPEIHSSVTWPYRTLLDQECNFAIAFGLVAAQWQIAAADAVLGYLQSWSTNFIAAGIKLIPLGQTAGQQILLNLSQDLGQATAEIQTLEDDQLEACGWGLSLASMAHETQYSRLFRS